ncbi:hypothetical protein MLD38_013202 [Melastoma candidum]|uniref:Uncharacterized protein n=1 Tax=Melastoma candidum TaxID=119954 RepID=A0ACB9RCF7_9MYRT|nr:hypothetical protein MLD38_013202 [Melastoma candidum]
MNWYEVQHQVKVKRKDGFSPNPPPFLPASPSYGVSASVRDDSGSSSAAATADSSSGARISPAVLFIIVILAVLFFISGLLHLLVRFLIRHPQASNAESSRYPDITSSDALQRQLQQLFHLHDSGLDQAVIDSLPVFQYREIVGLKEPFDCAVCLCEFCEKDKLRLLPGCSHAFHINCIDTWLLSNSTCPLCRGALFAPGLAIENPIFDYDDLREEDGVPGSGENGLSMILGQKAIDIDEIAVAKGVVPVRLGKFRKISAEKDEREEVIGETSSSKLDARRCYSMGSYQYVLGDSELQVSLDHGRRGSNIRIEECAAGGVEDPTVEQRDSAGKSINAVAKGESYSVSKIWQWSKKGKFSSSSEEQMGIPSSLKVDI